MLIGLFPVRGDAFALGWTLCKQARWWQLPLAVVLPNELLFERV